LLVGMFPRRRVAVAAPHGVARDEGLWESHYLGAMGGGFAEAGQDDIYGAGSAKKSRGGLYSSDTHGFRLWGFLRCVKSASHSSFLEHGVR